MFWDFAEDSPGDLGLRAGSVRSSSEMPDSTFEPLRIVSMGGGNGLSALLRGLKRYAKIGTGAVEITAVVTVTDTPLPFRVSYTSSGPRASLQSGL